MNCLFIKHKMESGEGMGGKRKGKRKGKEKKKGKEGMEWDGMGKSWFQRMFFLLFRQA